MSDNSLELSIFLPDEAATRRLGVVFSAIAGRSDHPPVLLLQGGLGSGKTTFVRGLVSALPGADEAEVSSPSFNIMNLYPTSPPVAHFDLYRLEGGEPDDEFFEMLEDGQRLVVVEWPEHLARQEWPEQALHLCWKPSRTGRALDIRPLGAEAGRALQALRPELETFIEGEGDQPQ